MATENLWVAYTKANKEFTLCSAACCFVQAHAAFYFNYLKLYD